MAGVLLYDIRIILAGRNTFITHIKRAPPEKAVDGTLWEDGVDGKDVNVLTVMKLYMDCALMFFVALKTCA